MPKTNQGLEEARDIGRFLRDRINKVDSESHAKERPYWTESVKCAFLPYLKREGFGNNSEVLPPKDAQKIGGRKDEFLVDFILWRRDLGGTSDLRGTKEGAWIACESEWDRNYEGILKDFNKLLSFRSKYKVMIYEIKNNEELGRLLRQSFEQCLEKFYWHIKDEAYIFIEFVSCDGSIANIYTCVPEQKATLSRAD